MGKRFGLEAYDYAPRAYPLLVGCVGNVPFGIRTRLVRAAFPVAGLIQRTELLGNPTLTAAVCKKNLRGNSPASTCEAQSGISV